MSIVFKFTYLGKYTVRKLKKSLRGVFWVLKVEYYIDFKNFTQNEDELDCMFLLGSHESL